MHSRHGHIKVLAIAKKAGSLIRILLNSYKKPKILLRCHKTFGSYKKWPNLIRKHDSYKILIRSYDFFHKGM